MLWHVYWDQFSYCSGAVRGTGARSALWLWIKDKLWAHFVSYWITISSKFDAIFNVHIDINPHDLEITKSPYYAFALYKWSTFCYWKSHISTRFNSPSVNWKSLLNVLVANPGKHTTISAHIPYYSRKSRTHFVHIDGNMVIGYAGSKNIFRHEVQMLLFPPGSFGPRDLSLLLLVQFYSFKRESVQMELFWSCIRRCGKFFCQFVSVNSFFVKSFEKGWYLYRFYRSQEDMQSTTGFFQENVIINNLLTCYMN